MFDVNSFGIDVTFFLLRETVFPNEKFSKIYLFGNYQQNFVRLILSAFINKMLIEKRPVPKELNILII